MLRDDSAVPITLEAERRSGGPEACGRLFTTDPKAPCVPSSQKDAATRSNQEGLARKVSVWGGRPICSRLMVEGLRVYVRKGWSRSSGLSGGGMVEYSSHLRQRDSPHHQFIARGDVCHFRAEPATQTA